MQTIAAHPATWALPKKPPESTPAHGAAAAVLPHRHLLIIGLGADPIHFVYRSHSPLATAEIILHTILFPPFSQANCTTPSNVLRFWCSFFCLCLIQIPVGFITCDKKIMHRPTSTSRWWQSKFFSCVEVCLGGVLEAGGESKSSLSPAYLYIYINMYVYRYIFMYIYTCILSVSRSVSLLSLCLCCSSPQTPPSTSTSQPTTLNYNQQTEPPSSVNSFHQ